MEEHYSIKVPVFEGPLDLLLHLIRENRIDIYDIPIALITRQYLEYLEMMKELDLDVAGEFLVMAATLIHIKSRMLLPLDEAAPEEEIMDPRFDLVQKLLEYQAFKDAAITLREREELWMNVFRREDISAEEAGDETRGDLSLFDLSLFDLLGAFRKILETAPPELISITREALTVKDRIAFILEKLEKSEAVRFEDLFGESRSRTCLVVTFVALLEVLRLGLARAYQEQEFGPIWVINPAAQPAPEISREAQG